MGLRITTWNVNGIRNPFGYQPWRDKRTFNAMFDTLEADIVVFQETKIQKRDLRDDMVLVPGWDCYFSLPRFKKGYSGVVIYTRNTTCAPIRAEEGVTGVLCHPNSSTSYRDLPEEAQIGGYPSSEQLSKIGVDASTLDSEGRCVILEFPAFVLVGVYSPANRDETRDTFRLGFVRLLDARVRNLIAMGKRVFLTGDLNIAKREIDSAHATEAIRKGTLTEDEFISSPARHIFNQLNSDGRVVGERDKERDFPVLFDICRSFHPDRRGMYTCWEQRTNARPGNYGARIDYVLCSLDMVDWFSDSNIQEGLMGSDHCPVYAVFKDQVFLDGLEVNIHDMMSPPGMFKNGLRQHAYSSADLLPLSGRLIPEFDRRRNIKDMFFRKSSTSQNGATAPLSKQDSETVLPDSKSPMMEGKPGNQAASKGPDPVRDTVEAQLPRPAKRIPNRDIITPPSAKRSKSATGVCSASSKGQQSLRGFFKPKTGEESKDSQPFASAPNLEIFNTSSQPNSETPSSPDLSSCSASQVLAAESTTPSANNGAPKTQAPDNSESDEAIVDPTASKVSWSKLFTKPAPKCEGHQEPCIMLTTKKAGMNCGRAFWLCPRPVGPNGVKEKGTEWRCPTFIWASDWNGSS